MNPLRAQLKSSPTVCVIGIGILACLAGCTSSGRLPRSVRKYELPTIAVLEFENKAMFPYDWYIGQGVSDLLVDSLVKTRRYTVLSRRELGPVLTELEAQKDPHFRPEGKVEQGRLKNAQYLIKGAVTEFTHTAGGGLWATQRRLTLRGRGVQAVVAITLYVIEVESSQIVAAKSVEGRATAGSLSLEGSYKGTRFGGRAFFRTPLGEATQKAMKKALKAISKHIGRRPWLPRVAEVQDGTVLLTGGKDRVVREGTLFAAYGRGENIVDPATGDVLGVHRGKRTAVVRVTAVEARYSVAEIVEGKCEVGQVLKSFGAGAAH